MSPVGWRPALIGLHLPSVAKQDTFSPLSRKEVESRSRPKRAGLKFPSRIEEGTGTIMKQTDNRARSVATTRAMNRAEFALDNLNEARGRIPDARMRERIVS
jgi:hypothetical protein